MEIDSKFLRTKSLCAWAGCEKLIKIFSGKLKIKFDSAPSLCTKKSATHRKKGSMKGNCFIKQWIWQEKSINFSPLCQSIHQYKRYFYRQTSSEWEWTMRLAVYHRIIIRIPKWCFIDILWDIFLTFLCTCLFMKIREEKPSKQFPDMPSLHSHS